MLFYQKLRIEISEDFLNLCTIKTPPLLVRKVLEAGRSQFYGNGMAEIEEPLEMGEGGGKCRIDSLWLCCGCAPSCDGGSFPLSILPNAAHFVEIGRFCRTTYISFRSQLNGTWNLKLNVRIVFLRTFLKEFKHKTLWSLKLQMIKSNLQVGSTLLDGSKKRLLKK